MAGKFLPITTLLTTALTCFLAATMAAQNAPDVKIGPAATIGFSNAPSLRHRSINGHFRPTAVYAKETILIRLDYDPTFVGQPILATPLDGGEVKLPKPKSVVDENGVAWVRFRAGREPGLYRLEILAGSDRSILKFWVDDPKNPMRDPHAIRRGNQG